MISKEEVKLIKSLGRKKLRTKERLFIAEGPKVVNDFLDSHYKIKRLFATKDFVPKKPTHNTQIITQKELDAISLLPNPNQVLGVFEYSEINTDISNLKDELIIALDDIRDPGNMGTLIRIADWFGIRHIICSHSCVDCYNPKVIQSTMGSLVRVSVSYNDLSIILPKVSTVFGAVLDGENIYKMKLPNTGVILIGNEANGISKDLLCFVANKISIPSFSNGAESLNAAMAGAIICSEFRRKM